MMAILFTFAVLILPLTVFGIISPITLHSSTLNRKELYIKNISSENNFEYGQNVTSWKSLTIKDVSYAIGIMKENITILEIKKPKNGELLIKSNVVDFSGVIADSIIWVDNYRKNRNEEPVLLVATRKNLYWYNLKKDLSLELLWTWNQGGVEHLNEFKINNERYLIIGTTDSKQSNTLTIYRHNYEPSSRRTIQVIPVEEIPLTTAINTFGRYTYLSFPQSKLNKTLVYRFEDDTFVTFVNITSRFATRVIPIQEGLTSYIAVNGKDSQIYKITNSGLTRQLIKHGVSSNVDFWFTIPYKTIRQETIILGQKMVNHHSHKSQMIQVILYDGQHFNMHEEMTCDFYGDIQHGMSCIVEEEPERGIIGAAAITLQNYIGILIPHQDLPHAGLFRVHTDLKVVHSPSQRKFEELKAIKERLEKMMQDDEYDIKIKHVISDKNERPIEGSSQMQAKTRAAPRQNSFVWPEKQTVDYDLLTIEKKLDLIEEDISNMNEALKTTITSFNENLSVKKLTINGNFKVLGTMSAKTVKINKINDKNWNDLMKNIVRSDLPTIINGHKTFNDLVVQNIVFNTANSISKNQMIFSTEEPLIIEGRVTFENPVQVAGDVASITVNDIKFEDQVILMNKTYDTVLDFENLVVDGIVTNEVNNFHIHNNYLDTNTPQINGSHLNVNSLYLRENLIADTVNDENFSDLVLNLYFNDEQHTIDEAIIDGNVFVNKKVNFEFLNNMKFPDDFVCNNVNNFTIITGSKTFSQMVADEVIVSGFVNKIKLDNVLTALTDQFIPGHFRIQDLEITELLKIPKNTTGPFRVLDIENPTLEKANTITSNVIFQRDLEVVGNIFLQDSLNGENFEQELNDVVYNDTVSAEIITPKNLQYGLSVKGNLKIATGQVGDIPVRDFFTTDTQQSITMKSINGDLEIDSLHLAGLFGGINITKLFAETVRTDGNQYISGSFTFTDDIISENLTISNAINNIPVDYFLFETMDKVFTKELEIKKLIVDDLVVKGEMTGSISGFDIKTFNKRRLSATRPQNINANFTLEQAFTNNLQSDYVNKIPFNDLFNEGYIVNKLSGMLETGKLGIKDLVVNGEINADSINGLNLNNLITNCQSKESAPKYLKVLGTAVFANLNTKMLNGVDFTEFISGVVYKNQTDVTFKRFKVFENGFIVTNYIDTKNLNYVPINNLFVKYGVQEIRTPVTLHGNVIIQRDTRVQNFFNGIILKDIADRFKDENDQIIINDDMVFQDEQFADNLQAHSKVNGYDLNVLLQNIVRISDNLILDGPIIFNNKVFINGNVFVSNLTNNIDLLKLKDDLIFTTVDTEIDGSVTFTEHVTVDNNFDINSDLIVRSIMELRVEDWINEAVYINKGKLKGNYIFEQAILHENSNVEFFNGINMSNIVPLRTHQVIDKEIIFNTIQLYHDVDVQGLVNKFKLKLLYDNSAQVDKNNIIKSSVIFGEKVEVENSLTLDGNLNGFKTDVLLTTKNSTMLSSALVFSNKSIIEGNLIINGHINNFNLTEWNMRRINTNMPQTIPKTWSIQKDIIFHNDTAGMNIGGFDMEILEVDTNNKHLYKTDVEKAILDEYVMACRDIDNLLEITSNQVYVFKQFENIQIIDQMKPISLVYSFEFNKNVYLLVNAESSCTSLIYMWNNNVGQFEELYQLETGKVHQVASTGNAEEFYLIILSNDTQCVIEGTNVWSLHKNSSITHVFRLEKLFLLQESLKPNTFYGKIDNNIIEYNLFGYPKVNLQRTIKWIIPKSNVKFVPRYLKTGLAVTDCSKLYKLIKDENNDYGNSQFNFEAITMGAVEEEIYANNDICNIEVVAMHVGSKKHTKLVAVSTHENITINNNLDYIEIYEDVATRKLFHKIQTYKPSSLTSIDFKENEESLLLFLKNQQSLEIYQYKGLEGFKLHSSNAVTAKSVFKAIIPIEDNERYLIGLVDRNKITIAEAKMLGNRVANKKIKCDL